MVFFISFVHLVSCQLSFWFLLTIAKWHMRCFSRKRWQWIQPEQSGSFPQILHSARSHRFAIIYFGCLSLKAQKKRCSGIKLALGINRRVQHRQAGGFEGVQSNVGTSIIRGTSVSSHIQNYTTSMKRVVISISEMENTSTVNLSWIPPYPEHISKLSSS